MHMKLCHYRKVIEEHSSYLIIVLYYIRYYIYTNILFSRVLECIVSMLKESCIFLNVQCEMLIFPYNNNNNFLPTCVKQKCFILLQTSCADMNV